MTFLFGFQAQSLLRNFDRLHSVLYSELSGELKKLRALACISETKLKIHQKRYSQLSKLLLQRNAPLLFSLFDV